MRTNNLGIVAACLVLGALACGPDDDVSPAPAVPRILAGPTDVTISPCGSATFSVSATGEPPLAFQWYREGLALAGANTSTFTVARAGTGDAGGTYSVSVTNARGTSMSAGARLDVIDSGTAIEFATPPAFGGMVVSEDTVYWTDGRGINMAPSDCSGLVHQIYERMDPGENTYALALTPTRVAWSDEALGAIRSMSRVGGEPTLIGSGFGGGMLYLLAASGETLLWPHFVAGMLSAPSDGGAMKSLYSGVPLAAGGIASDQEFVFWTDVTQGTINRMPIGGGPLTVLAAGQSYPNAITTDGLHVYWATATDWTTSAPTGSLHRIGRDGLGFTTLLTLQASIMQLALDATHVYASAYSPDPHSGLVVKVGVDGSDPPVVLASGLDLPFDVAVDARFLYWSDRSAIRRVPK